MKAELLKAEFYVNIMIRFEKKEQSDAREEKILEFQVLNTKSNNPSCRWVECCKR